MNENVDRTHKSAHDINMKEVDDLSGPQINYEIRLRSNVETGTEATKILEQFLQSFTSFPKRSAYEKQKLKKK